MAIDRESIAFFKALNGSFEPKLVSFSPAIPSDRLPIPILDVLTINCKTNPRPIKEKVFKDKLPKWAGN